MRRSSIKLQILVIMMVPVLMIDAVLTYIHVNDSVGQAEKILRSNGEIIAKQIAGASEFDLFSGNFDHIQHLLNRSINTNDIVFTAVYDSKGQVVAEVSGKEYNEAESSSYLYYRYPIQTQTLEGSDVFSTQIEYPSAGSINLGWVHLYISRQRLFKSKMAIYREALIIFCSTMLMAVILTFFISRRITKPVFTLIEYLKKIETGHLGEVIKPIENNEIGDVHKGFNSMSQALLANRMQLDQKIKTATLDLMNAITDLEYKNREISLARDEAQNANKVKSQFLANISHEIRTPINGIKGFANLLTQTGLNPQQRRYAEIINQSTSDLSSIVNEVLDFSKIESEKVEIIESNFDLYELAESTRDSLFTTAIDKHIDLYLTIYSDTPRYLVGDKLRLKQILINLIGNAIKFTDKGYVEIVIHLEEQSENQILIKFKIRDSGIGISKDDQKQLFQAFKQIESDSNRRFSGTGLGLVISKNLACLMGGDIMLDSVTNYGSLFTLVLPFKPGDVIDPQQLNENDDSTGLLIAFDKKALNEIQSLYNRAGFNTEFLLVDKEAEIQKIRSQIIQNLVYIDFIVMDLRHSIFQPDDLFDPDIRQQKRIIIMHYDLHLTSLADDTDYEFISVINTCKNLQRLITHQPQVVDIARKPATDPGVEPHSVLIVDDNPINLALAVELAQIWGHHPFEASNAEQAMKLFRIKTFDLILLDIQMPEIDGVKLMQMMRKERPDLKAPIAAITANILESEKTRLLELGFDAYFSKPIEENKLKALLDRAEVNEKPNKPAQRNENTELSVDQKLTYKLSANNTKLVNQIFSMLIKEIPYYQKNIQQSIDQNTPSDLDKLIHKLHGITCYAGLPKLKQLLDHYEMTKIKDPERIPEIGTRISEELDQIARTLAELNFHNTGKTSNRSPAQP
jgi:two-component system, NarL family, sensor histidine kinase BarA